MLFLKKSDSNGKKEGKKLVNGVKTSDLQKYGPSASFCTKNHVKSSKTRENKFMGSCAKIFIFLGGIPPITPVEAQHGCVFSEKWNIWADIMPGSYSRSMGLLLKWSRYTELQIKIIKSHRSCLVLILELNERALLIWQIETTRADLGSP